MIYCKSLEKYQEFIYNSEHKIHKKDSKTSKTNNKLNILNIIKNDNFRQHAKENDKKW